MAQGKVEPERFAELRKRAEAKRKHEVADMSDMQPVDVNNLVHELRTHEIELEMQNEDLRCAQEELIESRNRYSDLYNYAPIGFATVSDKGLITEANLTLATMLQVERRTLMNRPLSVFVVPADQDVFYLCRQTVIEAGQHHTCRLRMLRSGAEPMWVEMDVILSEPEASGGATLQMAIIDITSRKRAEDALVGEKALCEEYIDSLPGLFYVFDERRFVKWNRQWRRNTGCSDEQLAERYGTDFFEGKDVARIEEFMKKVFDGGVAETEAMLVTRHGQRIPYFFTGSLRKLNGRDHLVGLGIDVTERTRVQAELARYREHLEELVAERTGELQKSNEDLKRYRERLEESVAERTGELQRSNDELHAFCYSVSHDLRGPLRALSGFSHVIQEDYEALLDDTGRHYLNRISHGATQMAKLIDGLLRLARLSQHEIEVHNVVLDAMATDIAAELRQSDPERDVEVRIQPGLRAEGDPALLKDVLANLIGNAWKFTRRREHALIEFGALDSRTFFVRDNGVGFDMKYVDSLFETFHRLHSDEEFEGVGIGLSTVQRILARHGGQVWVEAALERGATFYFTLGS